MCKLNTLCLVSDGTCDCFDRSGQNNLFNFYQPRSLELNSLMPLIHVISGQSELLIKITKSLAELKEKISFFQNQSRESTTPSDLLSCIGFEKNDYNYSILLTSPLPNPVYKDRAFCFSVDIIDKEGKISLLNKNIALEIKLFTSDNPPRQIKYNTSGDKVLKYIFEDNCKSLYTFRKVFINDVSSHYRNGSLMLALFSNNSEVKPLIIEDLVIKARKIPSKSKTH